MSYEALLIVSFGGPEKMEDVMPFLENVLRGKPVPRERMLEVARHYEMFGGVSPINAQNRALIAALNDKFLAEGPQLPIYWGNRNWHPLLADTLQRMKDDGVRKALGFVTSAFSSYSGCRQYLENIEQARSEVGAGAPEVHKLRAFYNHPDFVEANVARLREAFSTIAENRRESAALVFTAHSIPLSMAENCDYEKQLHETCSLIADELGRDEWRLVYQSRSGSPKQPWLEPDILEFLKELGARGRSDVVVLPVGFVSDHMEVVYDLDHEAKELAREMGLNLIRAATVGVHPSFLEMVRSLVLERLEPDRPRRTVGRFGAGHDFCPEDCCAYRPLRNRS
jgi:ferrochelatase